MMELHDPCFSHRPEADTIKISKILSEMVEALSSRLFPFMGMLNLDEDPIRLIQSFRGNAPTKQIPTFYYIRVRYLVFQTPILFSNHNEQDNMVHVKAVKSFGHTGNL